MVLYKFNMGYIMAVKRGLASFQKAVAAAGTAEALKASSLLVKKAKLKALGTNTDLIYLGDSSVSSTVGYALAAGDEIDLHELYHADGFALDLAEIYIDAAVNGEGVSVLYLV